MKKIVISAGEASGDLLGAKLCTALKSLDTNLQISGMGSTKMQAAGVDLILNSDDIAVVGAIAVITNLKKIRHAFKTMKEHCQKIRPDLLILVDYPGFNLRLAKIAKKMGIKTLFYVSPQIWAWRYNRVNHIRQYVDKMAVLFKFEESLYQRENIAVDFVGHPLAESVYPSKTRNEFFNEYHFDINRPLICLIPGSRKSEVHYHLPILAKTVERIQFSIPNAQFALTKAPAINLNLLQPHLSDDIHIIENDNYNLIAHSDCVIAASGTVTLETALLETPLSIIYRGNPLTAMIVKRLLRLPHIGLCNVILEKTAAKEFLQEDANPENIANETIRLLNDKHYRQALIDDLKTVRSLLGKSNDSKNIAQSALAMIA